MIAYTWVFTIFQALCLLNSLPQSNEFLPSIEKLSQRKAMPKNAQTTTQLHSSHASKVMLKILQARLQQYVNHELPDVQAGFRKGTGTRDQIANIRWIMEKAREFQKNIYFCFIDYAKPLTVWITINSGKFWKRWEYQTTWPASWETYMQVRKQQLELDMNNRLVPNRKRSMPRLYIVTLLT